MVIRPQPRLFTVEEYYRMAEAGILGEDDRVELIEGEIVAMTPIGSLHAASVTRLNELFSRLVGEAATVRIQDPVRLSDLSEPEPDLAVVRRRPTYYAEGHPGPGDVLLLIEVADTSVDYDRSTKARLYGASGIPEYWVVDLPARRLHVYRSPSPEGYQEEGEAGPSEQIAPGTLPGLSIDLAEILGQ